MDIAKEKILVYDVETTGLDAWTDEILQFSACDGAGNKLMDTYIQPIKAKSWPDAMAVNGITPSMVSAAPTMDELRPQIQRLFDAADLLVAYNNDFDNGFLSMAKVDVYSHTMYERDMMLEFARIYGEWSDYFGDYKWQKLVRAASYYGFDWGSYKAHDSMSDVYATLHVFNHIAVGDTMGK